MPQRPRLQCHRGAPSRVVVKGTDRDGNERTVEGSGLLARAFQHEMDHLDGTLFVERLRGVKRDMIVRKIQKCAAMVSGESTTAASSLALLGSARRR